jgi:hypothetical protein
MPLRGDTRLEQVQVLSAWITCPVADGVWWYASWSSSALPAPEFRHRSGTQASDMTRPVVDHGGDTRQSFDGVRRAVVRRLRHRSVLSLQARPLDVLAQMICARVLARLAYSQGARDRCSYGLSRCAGFAGRPVMGHSAWEGELLSGHAFPVMWLGRRAGRSIEGQPVGVRQLSGQARRSRSQARGRCR